MSVRSLSVAFTLLAGTAGASNIRSATRGRAAASVASEAAAAPTAHARVLVENFSGQRVNPSELEFSSFTDARGEEKDVYSFVVDPATDSLTLKNFDRAVLTITKDAAGSAARAAQLSARKRLLEDSPVGLDTSATDAGMTTEGAIGAFEDRPLAHVQAAAAQEHPYKDTDAEGAVLAHNITVSRLLHNDGVLLLMPSSDILVGGTRQWKMVVHEDFDEYGTEGRPAVAGWNAFSGRGEAMSNLVGRCGRNISPRTDWFLGPYRSVEVSKTFLLPSDHTQAKLQANFHFLDGWDEQFAYMKINGKVVWQRGHSMCSTFSVIPELTEVCLQKGVNACGGEGTDLMGVEIGHQLEYFSNHLELTFGATLEKDNDASWGVDDVRIWVL